MNTLCQCTHSSDMSDHGKVECAKRGFVQIGRANIRAKRGADHDRAQLHKLLFGHSPMSDRWVGLGQVTTPQLLFFLCFRSWSTRAKYYPAKGARTVAHDEPFMSLWKGRGCLLVHTEGKGEDELVIPHFLFCHSLHPHFSFISSITFPSSFIFVQFTFHFIPFTPFSLLGLSHFRAPPTTTRQKCQQPL